MVKPDLKGFAEAGGDDAFHLAAARSLSRRTLAWFHIRCDMSEISSDDEVPGVGNFASFSVARTTIKVRMMSLGSSVQVWIGAVCLNCRGERSALHRRHFQQNLEVGEPLQVQSFLKAG